MTAVLLDDGGATRSELSKEEVDRLAALQLASLPDSQISRLGQRFLGYFYAFAQRSELELVIGRSIENRIVGGAFVSLAPRTLVRRLALGTPLLLFAAAMVLRRGSGSLMPTSIDSDTSDLPELMLLFSDAEMRRRGIGSQLVKDVDVALGRLGVSRYRVRTFNEDDHPAVRFYIRMGFECSARTDAPYRTLVRRIDLANPDWASDEGLPSASDGEGAAFAGGPHHWLR